MESITNQRKKNQRWIIILAVAVVITIGVIYWQNQSIKEDQMGIAALKSNIEQLKQEMKTIKNKKREVEINRDSLQKNLNYLWQYKTLVQSTKVRDQVGDNFNFHPGDRVRLKADSSIVVITDLMVGGNRYNYFVKFLIKNNKGLQSEVSPIEIEQIK
jgi:hypothetical protein